MADRPEVALGAVARVRSGYSFKSAEWRVEGIRVVKIANIKSGSLDMSSASFVDESTAAQASGFELRYGDVLMAMTGYVGEVARVTNHERLLLNQRVGRFEILDSQRLEPKFLFYYLRLESTREQLVARAHGSAQPNLSAAAISALRIPLPALPEQRAIAEVLGALDDKIAANIALTSAAWELAGAEFANVSLSSTEPRRLGEVVRLEYGKSLPTPSRQPGEIRVVGSGGVVGKHSTAIVEQTGVVVGRKGTAGSVHWIDGPHWPIDTTFYVTPVAPGVSQIYAYFLLSRLKLDQLNSDSAVPGLNRAEAEAIKLHIPSRERREQFAASTSALIELASQASRESNTLVETRDTLLPELMSGRLRVKDAEKKIEEVV